MQYFESTGTHPTYLPLTHMGCAVCTSSEMLRGPIHLLTLARFLVVPLLQMRSGAVAVFNARLLELHLQCSFKAMGKTTLSSTSNVHCSSQTSKILMDVLQAELKLECGSMHALQVELEHLRGH